MLSSTLVDSRHATIACLHPPADHNEASGGRRDIAAHTMTARKESLLSATPIRGKNVGGGGGSGSSGGSGSGASKAVRRFLGWAGRSGFFFLAAAAFMSSLSLLAFRGRALDLDGNGGGVAGGEGGNGATEEGDFDANGTLTKNAVFKQEVAALLNHSVPIFLSRKAIKSTRPFSCGGSAVVKFRTYMDIKKVSKLAESLPPNDPMTMAGDPTWRRYKTCAVVGNSGGETDAVRGHRTFSSPLPSHFTATVTRC